MNKLSGFLCIIAMIILLVSGCTYKKEIKSITMNEKTYHSLYLYSFDNAEITTDFNVLFKTPVDKPQKSGYVISKVKSDKNVDVWDQFFFIKDPDKSAITASDSITNADIVELIETFPIEVKEKSDTFIITYYTYNYSSDIQLNNLIDNSLKKHTIEVVKENVLIEYY